MDDTLTEIPINRHLCGRCHAVWPPRLPFAGSDHHSIYAARLRTPLALR